MLASRLEMDLDPGLIEWTLAPYKPHCRYLVKAAATYQPGGAPVIAARGEFGIPESCYIDDTGHFNAVEFNICYNQMAYCSLAHALQNHWLDSYCGWTLEQFRRRQLSDCMIIKLESRFRKPMNARQFTGSIALDKVWHRGDYLMMDTSCKFSNSSDNSSDVNSEGAVWFAVNMGCRDERH
jgi:hypothetical protein